jgi:hypothetical protein
MAGENDNAQGNQDQDDYEGFSAYTEEPREGSDKQSGGKPGAEGGKAPEGKDADKGGKQPKKPEDKGADDDAKNKDGKDDESKKDDDADNAGGNRTPRRLERRIARLTKRGKENGERADRLERELQEARTKLASYEEQDSKPKSKDFDNDEDFETALEAWAKKQGGKKAPQRRQTVSAEQQEIDDQILELVEDLKDNAKRFTDFETLVFNEETKITPDMALALSDTDDPAAIAYYLGTNRDEAKRIAGLTPRLQAKEIGKLEAKLAAESEKDTGDTGKKPDESGGDEGNALRKQSKAPAPIDTLKGSDSSKKNIEDMSFDEYEREVDKKGKGKIIENW